MHPTDGRITQEVFNPNQASGQAFPHTGRDYAGNRGDTIRTIADGVVLYVTRENEPVPDWLANRFMLVPGSAAGGNSLFIQHDGWVEYFGHMENITVAVGERVRRGQSVGGVGDSGNAFGCHLHYEVITEPCPATFPWGRYHPQDQIDYEDTHGGAASILPTGSTTPTPNQEGFLMALSDKQQQELYNWMKETRDRTLGGIPAGPARTPEQIGGANPPRLADSGDIWDLKQLLKKTLNTDGGNVLLAAIAEASGKTVSEVAKHAQAIADVDRQYIPDRVKDVVEGGK